MPKALQLCLCSIFAGALLLAPHGATIAKAETLTQEALLKIAADLAHLNIGAAGTSAFMPMEEPHSLAMSKIFEYKQRTMIMPATNFPAGLCDPLL
jgi:hypothetical protein